jgi:SAM-dependent methyltransferase
VKGLDFEKDLKEVLRGALDEQYNSVSPQDGIITGNHYQSVVLGDTRTSGFRTDRERVLDRIDFTEKKVLDLGSNLGELSRAARARGARLVDGYEYDPYFVRVANLINALNGVTRVSFARRDIADLETYDQRYDIVLAFAVFAYISGAIPRISKYADVLVFETHKLDGDFEEHYVRPISKFFPVHRVLAASDWGMETDQQAIRAVIVFAKDEETLQGVLKPDPGLTAETVDGEGRAKADLVADIRQLDVQRTSLQETFFETFKFDSPDELVAAVDAMHLDVETLTRSHDARKLVYSGWVYWLLFLKGYLDFAKTGDGGPGNIFFDYLTKHYGETSDYAGDPGVRYFLDDAEEATEVVRRRFEDMDNFRRDPEGTAARIAPLRMYLAEHDDGTAHPVFEVGRPAPMLARGIDGWHRLFAARVFGASAMRAEIVRPSTETPLRGAIDELEFEGEKLRLRGWCASPDGPVDAVEIRGRGVGELGIATMEFRPDIDQAFPHLPHAATSGFEFEGYAARRDDRQLRLEIIGLRDWEPLGVVNALYLPGMFDERKWPPPDLAQRMIGTGDERVMAVRAATFLYEILEPIKRWRNPRLFRSVLDWGCGVGLMERFMPRFLPNGTVTGIDWDEEAIEWCRSALPGKFVVVPGQPPAELPVDPADLVLGYSVLPRLDRHGQHAWLDVISRAMQSGGYAALTLRGELLRPFITDPDVIADIERDGISDRPAAGGTAQTKAYTMALCGRWFDVLAYIEGGVGNEHDLIVVRKP